MFLTLPKNYLTTGGDIPIFDGKRAIAKLTPVKDGVMMYELRNNSLIGQVFVARGEATVSIAESQTLSVKNVDGKIAVQFAGESKYSYEVFGNAKRREYKVYEYLKGRTLPVVSAQATANPFSDDDYCVFINDESNLVRNVLIVSAINEISDQA